MCACDWPDNILSRIEAQRGRAYTASRAPLPKPRAAWRISEVHPRKIFASCTHEQAENVPVLPPAIGNFLPPMVDPMVAAESKQPQAAFRVISNCNLLQIMPVWRFPRTQIALKRTRQ